MVERVRSKFIQCAFADKWDCDQLIRVYKALDEAVYRRFVDVRSALRYSVYDLSGCDGLLRLRKELNDRLTRLCFSHRVPPLLTRDYGIWHLYATELQK
jgi:hypothetical protein